MNLMKSKKSLLFATVLALFFSFILGGCGEKPEGEKDEKVVIAQVNGEDIFYDEFYGIYNYALTSQGIDPETEDEEQLSFMEEIKDKILEDIITRKIMLQKMKADGYEITDETMKEAEKRYNDIIEMTSM